MSSNLLQRFAGPAAVAGSLVWILFFATYIVRGFDHLDLTTLALAGVAALLFLVTLGSLFEAGTIATKLGLGVTMVGMGAIATGALLAAATGIGNLFLIVILGEMVSAIGLVILGVANLRDRLLPRLNGLFLLMALIFPLSLQDGGQLPPPIPANIPELMSILFGLGWLAVGLLLLPAAFGREAEPATNAAGR